MSRARFKRGVCVGDGHSGVVVQVYFDIACDDATEGADEVVNLARIRATDGVGDADAVDADLVHRLVDGKEVDEIGAERIFRRESDLDALGLDKVDDLDRALGNIGHVLAMRKFTEEGGCADDNVYAIYARLDSDARIVHMATDVGEDFGLQAELADGLAVKSRLLGSCWRCQLQIFDAKIVKGFSDGDLGLGVKEGIGKLLPLCTKPRQSKSSVKDKDRHLGECSR